MYNITSKAYSCLGVLQNGLAPLWEPVTFYSGLVLCFCITIYDLLRMFMFMAIWPCMASHLA